MRRSRKGPLWPTSEAPEVKGHYCDSAGSSEGLSWPPKQNSQGAERLASLATPTRLPGILAGSRGARDQGSPSPGQIQTGSRVIRGARANLSSQRSSFQGNVSPSPSTQESSVSAGWLSSSKDCPTSALCCVFRRCVFVLIAASHGCWTPLWEDKDRVDAHTHAYTHSFLLQSKHVLKLYQIVWYCRPGV